MKKAELIQHISEQTQFPKAQVKAILDLAFETISEDLAKGESVVIPGLGKFIPKDRPASTKTNPETGETVEVPAKKIVAFRAAKPIQEKLAAQ